MRSLLRHGLGETLCLRPHRMDGLHSRTPLIRVCGLLGEPVRQTRELNPNPPAWYLPTSPWWPTMDGPGVGPCPERHVTHLRFKEVNIFINVIRSMPSQDHTNCLPTNLRKVNYFLNLWSWLTNESIDCVEPGFFSSNFLHFKRTWVATPCNGLLISHLKGMQFSSHTSQP